MPNAARISDMHTCPMVNPGPVPHVGGPVSSGSPDVLIGYIPAARVGDTAVCVPAVDSISAGSANVLINNKAAARIGDPTNHGGVIVVGCPTVIIGDTGQSFTLRQAAKSGTPFCEECERAKREQGELRAPPPPNLPPPDAALPGETPQAPAAPSTPQPVSAHLDEELSALAGQPVLVPDNPGQLAQIHAATRAAIQSKIGEVNVGDPDAVDGWQNSATTVAQLHRDAKASEGLLRSVVTSAAAESGGQANFGPGGRHAVKELASLDNKVNVKGKRLEKISDAVRGTVIVERPEDIKPAVAALKKQVEAAGGQLVVDNKFAKPNKAGYGAVHADMLLPTKDGGTIRSEVQIHLEGLHDGTEGSLKEQSHAIYKPIVNGKEVKLTPAQTERADQASMLLWQGGMAPYGA